MIHTPGRTEVCVHLECEYLGKPFAPEALIAKIESARRVVGEATVAVAG
jgi:DNA-binding response OmpR family regulator